MLVTTSVIVGIALCLIVFFLFLYTPTITVHVENDTSQQLTVSTCGSDPQTIDPGHTASVDPNPNDSKAACVVYRGNTNEEIGCLPIPTTRYVDESTVRISTMRAGIPAAKCGD